MEKFFFLFDTGIPLSYLLMALFSIVIVCLFLINGIKDKTALKRVISKVLLIGYIAFVFSSTVIFRPISREIEIQWVPFYSYYRAYNGAYHLYIENVLNIFLFVPIGVLFFFSLKRRRGRFPVLFGFCMSLIIELLQLTENKGECEIDDLIHNTLGCLIGFEICKMFDKNNKYIEKNSI